jgi:uncharacterized membrane protein YccC
MSPLALAHRPSEDWYLHPPPMPTYDTLELEKARERLAEWQDFTTAAVLQIRYVVAKLRARGSAPNVEAIVDRYAAASRQAFESTATLTRSVETLRQTARDLRRQGVDTQTRYPDIAAPLFAKADEIDQRLLLFGEHAKGHQRLVEAYSEALKALATVRSEPPRMSRAAPLVGPALGAATLGGVLFPNAFGVAVGLAIGFITALLGIHAVREGKSL